MKLTVLAVLFCLPAMLAAQKPTGPIMDNSFLLEEAYNQEAGVVQHISVFNRNGSGGGWQYGFTQEWPFISQKHQLSYTVPLERTGAGLTGLGDIGLNYRYQLYNNDTLGLAIAPRISMILPTGSRSRGLGGGVLGPQFNLPVSKTFGPRLTTHWNAGITFFPGSVNAGDTASVTNLNLGQSFVFLLAPTVNLMLETVWTREEAVTGPDQTTATKSLFISPGVRFALNFESGLQIVPGIAFPIGVGPSKGESSVVLYLSFEHFFKR